MRTLILLPLLVLTATAAWAVGEPPIIAFQSLVADSAGVTRRMETYPLAAFVSGQYASLADEPMVEPLLKSHAGLKFSEIAPKGQICASIPVGLGPSGNAPADNRPNATMPRERPRDLTLVVYSSSSQVSMVTSGVGIPMVLKPVDEPQRPTTDPIDAIRRFVGESLGVGPEAVALEKFGEFDFDGDRFPEAVYVGSGARPGRSTETRSLLTVVRPGVIPLPLYLFELSPGARLMGVGDINGDGSVEMIVKTGPAARDFGLEVHAWRNRTVQRVFEHRSYGCY